MAELLYLYIPDGDTLHSEIILSSYNITECYYNKLSPVDSSAKLSIPFNQTIATALKTHSNKDIKAVINNGVKNIFTGVLRTNFTFSKTSINQPISLEIVSMSKYLDKEFGTIPTKQRQTLYKLIDYLLIQCGFYTESHTIYQYSTNSTTYNALNQVIDVVVFSDTDKIKDLLSQLCFECGLVYNFDNNGDFKVYSLFDAPSTVNQTFTIANLKEELQVVKSSEEYDNVCGKWTEKKYYDNALIFSDTQSADDTNKCNITIESGDYLFGEATNYCEYDNENGSVIWADTATLTVKGVSSSEITQENLGTKYSVSYKNNTSSTQTITQFDIYGSAWIEIEGENQTRANTGSNTKDIDIKYLNSKSSVESLVSNVLNYYKYADFTVTCKSFTSYAIGSFVEVSASGIGTITCRIIQKKTQPSKAYEYKLEAISEYSSSVITTTRTTKSSVNASSVNLINTTQEKLSNIFNTQQITLYRESASVLSASDLPTSDLVYNFGQMLPSWTNCDAGYPDKSNGWSWNYPDDAENTVYVIVATAQSQTSSATINPSSWTSPIPSGQNGLNGMNAYTLTLYARESSAPTYLPNTITYNFSTGAITGVRNGWNTSIPQVDSDKNPVWEIHATALSESTTDTIEPTEWSTPTQITSDGMSVDEVKAIVKEEIGDIAETPNVYADFTAADFYVDSQGYTTDIQSVDVTLHVVQNNEELDFRFDTDYLDANLPSALSYSINAKTIRIQCNSGVKLVSGAFKIPVLYAPYKLNAVIAYTADGEEYILTSDDKPLGYNVMSEDTTQYSVGFTYTASNNSRYLGAFTDVSKLPTEDVNIGDYLSWTGVNTESTLSKDGEFNQCGVYYFSGSANTWRYQTDKDITHISGAMQDVLSIANADLENNNSDAYLYLSRLTASQLFTKLLIANTAFIAQLVADKGFISALTSDNAFISALVSDEAFISALEASSLLADYAKITDLNADNIDATNLVVDKGTFTDCEAENLDVTEGTFTNCNATNLKATDASIDGTITGKYKTSSTGYKLNASDGSAEFNGDMYIKGEMSVTGKSSFTNICLSRSVKVANGIICNHIYYQSTNLSTLFNELSSSLSLNGYYSGSAWFLANGIYYGYGNSNNLGKADEYSIYHIQITSIQYSVVMIGSSPIKSVKLRGISLLESTKYMIADFYIINTDDYKGIIDIIF